MKDHDSNFSLMPYKIYLNYRINMNGKAEFIMSLQVGKDSSVKTQST